MAGSTFGKNFTVTTWGESHGRAVGAVIDGCPAGLPLCEEDIQVFLDRRKPGQSRFTTARRESDTVQILSGVFEGKTTGTPISLLIPNEISAPGITAIWLPVTVRDTQTIPLKKSTGSATTGAAAAPPDGRPSAG